MCEVDDSVADRKPAALPAALQCLWCWRQLSRCVGQDEVAAVRSPQLLASQEEWPGEDMSAATELLWPGAALLLLLGAAAGLCVRCSRPGAKKSEKIYEQRSLQENQQSFSVARTYSLVGQSWPAALVDTASDVTPRKDKLLRFSPSTEDSASPRYQNFSKGSRHGSDAVYIDPITMDYYNWGQFQKPLEGDDDDNSYENVLLCKQKSPESVLSLQVTRDLRIIRTRHPSISGRNPGRSWSRFQEKHLPPGQEAQMRTAGSLIM
ncbi:linker for activation of T-cells family member 2 isoform X2 [Manis pentadactyla]|uniref:linker for activation of T-cells family member 2 isoform X2 n=1 Tax=Manis pentadactyla TaxID=143292 RepID=UPI001875A195|nr:linker for activation of T-cells family member 2 isoform X2 [Manis pentadactyla]